MDLAVLLVNELAVTQARGRPAGRPAEPAAGPFAGPVAGTRAGRRAALEAAFARSAWTPSPPPRPGPDAAAQPYTISQRDGAGAGGPGAGDGGGQARAGAAGSVPDGGAAGTGLALTDEEADRLTGVAAELRPAFTGASEAVAMLNQCLVRHAAVPNLYGDPPMLAFHRPEADRVDAWAADAATALAMVIGVGQGIRLRSCDASGCDLVFFDVTRNASRRFCGVSCQNRAKASAYRARRRA
ncbi:CGNR zinc finger domain-containing protein [Nonomuraea sp. B10E15]|uniref:CGNR zinc finger domain-containing protein n=1 Tax=Nonomuraea sp. B10E15 TaxID=3153560 RepID=UPI00325D0548